MSPLKATPPNHTEIEEADDLAMNDMPLGVLGEFLVSDQLLFDMMPGVKSQRSEESIQNPESPSYVNFNGSCRLQSGPLITETITANESPGVFLINHLLGRPSRG